MNKWYRPFGLLLLASLVGGSSGCAQMSGWLADRAEKKTNDEKLAANEKKSQKRKKPAKEIAAAKAEKSNADKNEATAKKQKPKSVDSEHEKYTAADRQKRAKPAVDPFAETEMVAHASPPTKNKPLKTAESGDELDSYLADARPTALKKATKKQVATDEFDLIGDETLAPSKDIVQAKKEVTKGDSEDEFADWANSKNPTDSKSAKNTKPFNVSNSFEDELESPFAAAESPKSNLSKSTAADELPEILTSNPKKAAVRKEQTSGLQTLCPDAEGELRVLLKSIEPSDSDSLKQGIHRIGQMGTEGAAAAPLLHKMLRHEDAFVRAHSALTMARLKLTSPESIAVVTDSLKSRDASLRSFCSAILIEMGPQAKDVLKSLAVSLKDPDGLVRIRVAEVLIRHSEWSYLSLQTLLACLKEKNEKVRWMATYSLAELAPESDDAVRALLKATHDPVSKVQLGAVQALGEIGPFANRASGELTQLAEVTNDEDLKTAIALAVRQMNE